MRIGERLIRDQIITPEQLDEGLRAQVLRGGRLGTNLVELGSLRINTLAECLGRHHGMPAVLDRHFELVTPEVQARLPRELAQEWRAVPVGRLADGDDRIAVAVMQPLPETAVAAIAAALGGPIVLAVAPELRLLYQLERAYGIPRSYRFLRTDALLGIASQPPAADTPAVDAPVTDATDADAAPAQLARIAIKRVAHAGLAAEPGETDDPTSMDAVLRSIRQATGRDRVGDLVVLALRDFFDGLFDAGLILVVRERIALGWKGFVRDRDSHIVEAVALPLDAPSMVAHAFQTQQPHVGPPPGGGAGLDRQLWTLLKTAPPPIVAVVPIVLDGQAVCFLYAQTSRAEPAATEAAARQLAALAQSTTRAFTRLIRAAQR